MRFFVWVRRAQQSEALELTMSDQETGVAVESVDTDEEKGFEPTVKIEDIGPATKKISIEVSEEDIADRLQENFQSLQDEATIPGFRRGRAPKRLLEKRFGGDVRKEVCSQLLSESMQVAVEDHDLRVLGQPDIKDLDSIELPESGSLSFEVEVEVVPEITLPDLKGMKIKKPSFEIKDDQVEKEIDRYREMYGQFKPADETALDDYVTVDVTVKAADAGDDDEVLDEKKGVQILVPGESRKGKGVVSGIVIEELGGQLAGKKLGDTVSIETKGPARHENEKLVDAELKIEISITKIDRLNLLEVDELVEAVGMESADELRDLVRSQLQERADSAQQQAMAEQVADQLLDKIEIELPEKLSGQQAGRILQRRAIELMQQGASQQDVEERLAELREASAEDASEMLKMQFIFDAVAQKLEVEVGDAELNGRIFQIAQQQGKRPEKLRREMEQSGQLQSLYVQLREEKAIEAILKDAELEDITAEDWEKELVAEEEAEQKAEAKEKKGGAKKEDGEEKKTTKKTTKKKTTKKSSGEKKKDDGGKKEGEAKSTKKTPGKTPGKTTKKKTTKKKSD